MNRRGFSRYYRRVRTTQERRQSFACDAQYVRSSRNAVNLPNSWDDISVHHDKSWKSRRKTQYRVDGRGKKNELVMSINDEQLLEARGHTYRYAVWRMKWHIEEYFSNMDIPYEFEEIKQYSSYQREKKEYVVIGKRPVYVRCFKRVVQPDGTKKLAYVISHQTGWQDIGEWRGTGEFETIKSSKTIGYRITWWSNKDIGMDYILASLGHY